MSDDYVGPNTHAGLHVWTAGLIFTLDAVSPRFLPAAILTKLL